MNKGQNAQSVEIERRADAKVTAAANSLFQIRPGPQSERELCQQLFQSLAQSASGALLQGGLPSSVMSEFIAEFFPKRSCDSISVDLEAMFDFLEEAMPVTVKKAPIFIASQAPSCVHVASVDFAAKGVKEPFATKGFCCARETQGPLFNIAQQMYCAPNTPQMDWLGSDLQQLILAANILESYANLSGITIYRSNSYRLCKSFISEVMVSLSPEGGSLSLETIDDFLIERLEC